MRIQIAPRHLRFFLIAGLAMAGVGCASSSPCNDFERVRGRVIPGNRADSLTAADVKVEPGTLALHQDGVSDTVQR